MVFAVGTDNQTVQNDFDTVYPWAGMRRCCCALNSNSVTINAYKGQPGYAEDGSNGEVLVRVPRFYVAGKIDVDPKISMYALPGFRLPAKFRNADGSAKECCYLRAFTGSIGEDGKLHSIAGKTGIDNKNIEETLAAARLWGEKYSMETDADFEVELYLMVVAMATRNAQSYLRGCVSLYSPLRAIAAAQTDSASVLVATAEKTQYWPGVVILPEGCVTCRIVTAVEDDADTGLVRVSVSGDAFTTTTDNKIYRIIEATGTTSIAATCGSNGSCTNGLHGFVFYGLENPLYGSQWRFVASTKLVDGRLYYCADPTKYSWTSMDGYVEVGYSVPQSIGWQKTCGQDARYPEVVAPTEIGGSDGTYLSDSLYNTMSGVRVLHRGGSDSVIGPSGPFALNGMSDCLGYGFDLAGALSVPY